MPFNDGKEAKGRKPFRIQRPMQVVLNRKQQAKKAQEEIKKQEVRAKEAAHVAAKQVVENVGKAKDALNASEKVNLKTVNSSTASTGDPIRTGERSVRENVVEVLPKVIRWVIIGIAIIVAVWVFKFIKRILF